MSHGRFLVRGSSEQEKIPAWIFDDEVLGAPRLFFQFLMKGDTSGMELNESQLDLAGCGDGHGYRQEFLSLTYAFVDQCLFDEAEMKMGGVATDLRIVSRLAVTENQSESSLLTEEVA